MPVLLRETVAALQPAAGKIFLDGTVGGGGHALALLEAGASVIACDQDPEALAEASRRLAGYSSQVRFVESNFADVVDRLSAASVSRNWTVFFSISVFRRISSILLRAALVFWGTGRWTCGWGRMSSGQQPI